MSLADDFWSKVNKHGPMHPVLKTRCWVWTAGKFPAGYGSYWIDGRDKGAHRVSWYITHGRWPTPSCLHKCDNPSCVRPSHLFEGTPGENMKDKVRKGRDIHGEAVCTAKLTVADIKSIRAKYASKDYSQIQLAEEYGVRQGHISRIVRKVAWRVT